MILTEKYITYTDIRHLNLVEHFSTKYKVKPRVIQTLIAMCNEWGASRTHECVEALKGTGTAITYREVRYMHRVQKLHNELLSILKPGAKISEAGIISRLNGDDIVIEYVDGVQRIKGTYRELVFRRA